MALANNHSNGFNKKCEDSFNELMEFISTKDENQIINKYFLAKKHIESIQNENKKLREKNLKYREFFELMSSFLPKEERLENIRY
jgi:hypothetical protein